MSSTSSTIRLRGEHQTEKYVLPQKLSQDYSLVVASSTKAYGLFRYEGNDQSEVEKNRRQFMKDVGASLDEAVFMNQVHGDHIEQVDASYRSRGALTDDDMISHTDGLITNEARVFLSVLSADCVPVVAVDRTRHALGVAHAGWMGTVALVGAKLVQALVSAYDARADELDIYLGPAIGACCYTVGEDRISMFTDLFGNDVVRDTKAGKTVDLYESLVSQLTGVGCDASRIEQSDLCTSCENVSLPSYRVEQQAIKDRMITVAGFLS